MHTYRPCPLRLLHSLHKPVSLYPPLVNLWLWVCAYYCRVGFQSELKHTVAQCEIFFFTFWYLLSQMQSTQCTMLFILVSLLPSTVHWIHQHPATWILHCFTSLTDRETEAPTPHEWRQMRTNWWEKTLCRSTWLTWHYQMRDSMYVTILSGLMIW